MPAEKTQQEPLTPSSLGQILGARYAKLGLTDRAICKLVMFQADKGFFEQSQTPTTIGALVDALLAAKGEDKA